jgi:hypothetical protein
MSSIQMPEKIDAQRLLAPALTLRAVCPAEPPTGWPLKKPEARLPTPWARKSRLESDIRPSGFGTDSLTPAPCTSTMAATASVPSG